MLVIAALAFLLAGSPGTNAEETLPILPTRTFKGMKLLAPLTCERTVHQERRPRFALTFGGFSGDTPSYQAYPLSSPTALTHGVTGGLILNIHRLHVTTEAQFRIQDRGWWTDATGHIRLFNVRSVSVNLSAWTTQSGSGDMLYRGPADIGLGMHRKTGRFLIGTSLRKGNADFPVVELTTLFGRSRTQQRPELWLNDGPIASSKPLSQIERNPMVAIRLHGSRQIADRIMLTANVGYTDWFAMESLVPDSAFDIRGGVYLAVNRWCTTNVFLRWTSDSRGPNPYQTALTFTLTVRKW